MLQSDVTFHADCDWQDIEKATQAPENAVNILSHIGSAHHLCHHHSARLSLMTAGALTTDYWYAVFQTLPKAPQVSVPLGFAWSHIFQTIQLIIVGLYMSMLLLMSGWDSQYRSTDGSDQKYC